MSPRESDRLPLYQRIDVALTAASIGTWEWNPGDDRVQWSEGFERLHGFEEGAFGSSLDAYQSNIHPEDRERVVAALRGCAETGDDYEVEYRLVGPDGTVHHVEATGCRIADADGYRLVGVCRDVSQRTELLERERAARLAAEQSELSYRTLAATIPQQVWTATPDGNLDFVNQRTADYFGRDPDSIIGAGWQGVVHPADLGGVVASWTHSLASGEEYEVEFRLRRHDGHYRWHLGRAVPLRDGQSGRIVRWLGTNTDIDERKRMLSFMSTQVEVARLLVNARSLDEVADPLLETVCRELGWTCAQLWIVDRREGVLKRTAGWCGPVEGCRFEELATYDRMAFGTGLPGRVRESRAPVWIEDVQRDPDFPRAPLLERAGLQSAFGFPLIVSGEVAAVLEVFSAEPRPYEQSTVEVSATFGNHIGQFIQRIAAETELSSALVQLRQSNQVKDRFISIASHELKTPMTGILGWVGLLKKDDDPALREEALGWIEESARTQARLIEDILDSARIREGKVVLRQEDTDLSSVVATAVRVVTSAAEQRGVRIRLRTDGPAPVHGDPARLQQVAWNILSNAIKFSEPGGDVDVSLETSGGTAALTVQDRGAGIAPESLARIFEPFEQEDGGKAAGGLGLGLHITQTIVRMHGGEIEARSEGPGKGTTVVVRLPLA